MKKQAWLICFLWLPVILNGQQRPLSSQYFLNKYYDNPAFGGMSRSLQVDVWYRDQYKGWPGSPSTISAGFHLPLYRWLGGGGFQLTRYEAGVFQMVQAAASYNYVMRIKPGFLSFGARLGIHHAGYNGEKITTPEGQYEGTINHNDPLLPSSPFAGTGAYWEAGVYLYNPVWETGIMLYNFPTHDQSLGLTTYTKLAGAQWSGQYGFRYDMYQIIAHGIIRTDFRKMQTDFGMLVRAQENFFGGLSLRGYDALSIDALIFTIGTDIGKHYKLSYAYDLGLSDARNVHDGSHEIMLSYNLNKAIGAGLSPKVIRNPRHL